VLRSRLTPVDLWPMLTASVLQRLVRVEAERGFTDFEDLIERCAEEHIPPAVPFDALYVDECQDLSASEVRLCATWAQMARAFVMVGDPRQCLYEWRGSDPDLFGELIRASKKSDVLRQSWRVPARFTLRLSPGSAQLQDGIDAEYLPKDEVTAACCRLRLSLRRA
jgi:superfamily I DNA/RNA helicase